MSPMMLASDIHDMTSMVAVGGSMSIVLVAIVGGIFRSVFVHKHREESRREIAAYVAEGSMSSEDAAKILGAGQAKRGGCC